MRRSTRGPASSSKSELLCGRPDDDRVDVDVIRLFVSGRWTPLSAYLDGVKFHGSRSSMGIVAEHWPETQLPLSPITSSHANDFGGAEG